MNFQNIKKTKLCIFAYEYISKIKRIKQSILPEKTCNFTWTIKTALS